MIFFMQLDLCRGVSALNVHMMNWFWQLPIWLKHNGFCYSGGKSAGHDPPWSLPDLSVRPTFSVHPLCMEVEIYIHSTVKPKPCSVTILVEFFTSEVKHDAMMH